MQLSFAFAFRMVVSLLLTAHVFYMYCTARGQAHAFGYQAGPTIVACLFALVMLLPFVWAVFLPELPEYLDTVGRRRRRWRKGLCPHCAYDRISLPRHASTCPECGGELNEPEPMKWFSPLSIKRFVMINLLAWAAGCVAGELWMQDDERRFRDEATRRLASQGDGNYVRPRRWPNHNDTMMHIGPSPSNVAKPHTIPANASVMPPVPHSQN